MQNQDMSMEEILASIRKIISEDKKPGEERIAGSQFSGDLPVGRENSREGGRENGQTPGVLDLNHQIQEDGSIQVLGSGVGGEFAHASRKSSHSSHGTHVPRGTGSSGFSREAPSSYGPSSSGQARGVSPAALPTVPSASQGRPGSASYRDSVERIRPSVPHGRGEQPELLMSRNTAAASLENLQKVMSNQRVLLSQESSQTLEGMVQETLKPLLRTWLDAHLPALVERVVREQVQLMSRQA